MFDKIINKIEEEKIRVHNTLRSGSVDVIEQGIRHSKISNLEKVSLIRLLYGYNLKDCKSIVDRITNNNDDLSTLIKKMDCYYNNI